MPKRGGVTMARKRSEFYRAYGGVRIKHNGLGFDARPRKMRAGPIEFNSGPAPRDAVFDFVRLICSLPPDVREMYW